MAEPTKGICSRCECPWDAEGECGCEPDWCEKCPRCAGSGLEWEGWYCEYCEGTGELEI
jgi:hypothetical protein